MHRTRADHLRQIGHDQHRVRGLRDPDSTKYVGDPKLGQGGIGRRVAGIAWRRLVQEQGEAVLHGQDDFVVKDVITGSGN